MPMLTRRLRTVLLVVGAMMVVPPIPSRARDAATPIFQHDLAFAAQQLTAVATALASTKYPFTANASGAWQTTGASSWTSGFFPGSLWLLYQNTGDSAWRTRAQQRQAAI